MDDEAKKDGAVTKGSEAGESEYSIEVLLDERSVD